MTSFRPDIPSHVADAIRSLHPDLKQLIKSAIRAIAANPECENRLSGNSTDYESTAFAAFAPSMPFIRQYKSLQVIRLMAADHRRSVYEELTERLRRKPRE